MFGIGLKVVPLLQHTPPGVLPHWGRVRNFVPPRGSDGGLYTGFEPPSPRRGASIVPRRSPRVAGLVHVSVMTVPKMGITREICNFEHLY